MFKKNMGYKSKHAADNNLLAKLRENFIITSTKASKIWGMVMSAILLVGVVWYFYSKAGTFSDYNLGLIANAIISVVIGFAIAYKLNIKNNRINQAVNVALLLISPILLLTMSELLNKLLDFGFTVLGFFGGYFLILFLILLVYAVVGSFKISFITVETLVLILSIIHFYLFKFRGTPFLPMDILAAQTAANVATTYDFSPEPILVFTVLLYLLLLIFVVKTSVPEFSFKFNISSRLVSAAVSVVTVVIYISTNFFVSLGIKPDFWNQYFSCINQGFLLNFVGNFKYMYVSEPDGYNYDEIDEYINETYNNSDDNSVKTDTPNIICIMNEALSDLSVLGDFETNEDYMPFMRNLTKNTVKGNLYMSVIGGGTSNSEFEFLTGHSMAFMPSGSYPYQSYIKKPISSIVSTLKCQGYSVESFHPYRASGWSRTNVYGNLGFDKFISLENMFNSDFINYYNTYEYDPSLLQSYVETYYPNDTDMLLRQYFSDTYDFRKIIEYYENRDSSKPYFMFNVTMQNHGGYTMSASNFNENIKVTSTTKNYDDVNRYLSLVKESDKAFEELIEYFSNIDDPTVICMFGDHQPSFETKFINNIMEIKNSDKMTIEQKQSRYCTPFYIWANYDIEERYIEALSANYLSALVLDIANVNKTTYNKYLLKLSETLPVIDFAGYIDNAGNYYTWEDESPYEDLLNNYEKIQYNNLFDQENVDKEVFYINGYVPEATDLTN